MGNGRIEGTFFDDGFKVTYFDGVTEKFHKNLLDNNYKGDKGSRIVENWLDDGFTVNRYDGTKEQFRSRDNGKYLMGNRGTKVREGFWGDYYVSENPYSDYKPPTFADVRKAKYQETLIRAYQIEKNVQTDMDEVKSEFQDIIETTRLPIHVSNVDIDGMSVLALVSNENPEYMPVCSYFSEYDGAPAFISSVRGKGGQTKAADLSSLFYKASSPWGKLRMKASRGGAMANYFGYSVRAGGVIGGFAALTGFAISGGIKFAAKGVKALLRDNAAYRKEMDFYSQAAGIIDYTIGYNDSYNLNKLIMEQAEKGIPLAQYRIGLSHVYGIGVEANETTALEWFEKAAENGDLRSQNIVAGEYLYNEEKDYSIEKKEKAVTYLYNLASFGEEWAWELLIDIYGKGSVRGLSRNYDEAIRIAEILSETGNVYAASFLAPIYDTQINNDAEELLKYKNDKAAHSQYEILANHGDSDIAQEAAYRLACMYHDGRGTERDDASAVRYFEIAASGGNLKAKAALLDAYSNGTGTPRSSTKVKSLAKDLKKSGDAVLIAKANYALFTNAVNNNQLGESLRIAKEYLAGEYTETSETERLRKHIADIEEKVSNMTEEERRVFLNEPKRLSDYLKGLDGLKEAIIKHKKEAMIATALVIAIVAVISVTASLLNDHPQKSASEDAVNPKAEKSVAVEDKTDTSEAGSAALSAYNSMLSQESFMRDGTDDVYPQTWHAENCTFDTVYLNEDDIPELIIVNTADTDLATGNGQLYTYSDGEIIALTKLSDPDAANEESVVAPGYYKGTGWLTDFEMWQGSGRLSFINPFDETAESLSMNYEMNEGGEFNFSGYSIGMENVDEAAFDQKLQELTGDAEIIPYEFKDNTADNRASAFGINDEPASEVEQVTNETESDPIGGVAFDFIGKTYGEIEEEYGTLEKLGPWEGAVFYSTPGDNHVGFRAGLTEDGTTPADTPCTAYDGTVSDVFNAPDDISLQDLADLIGEDLNEEELTYSEPSNVIVWYINHKGTEYKVMIEYDENLDITYVTLTDTDR